MPAAYEKIRDKFLKEGKSSKEAKTAAARIYNSMRSKNQSLPKLDNTHKTSK
jgi:hypothetical protein